MYECVCPCMSEAGSKQHFGVSTLFSFQCPALGKVTRIIPLLLCSLAHFCLFGYVVCSYCTVTLSRVYLVLLLICWMLNNDVLHEFAKLVAFVLLCILRVLKLNLWSSCSSSFPLSLQLLFTLTFWLLVRQSVKENFSRKRKIATPLQEVTTGGQNHTHNFTLTC